MLTNTSLVYRSLNIEASNHPTHNYWANEGRYKFAGFKTEAKTSCLVIKHRKCAVNLLKGLLDVSQVRVYAYLVSKQMCKSNVGLYSLSTGCIIWICTSWAVHLLGENVLLNSDLAFKKRANKKSFSCNSLFVAGGASDTIERAIFCIETFTLDYCVQC